MEALRRSIEKRTALGLWGFAFCIFLCSFPLRAEQGDPISEINFRVDEETKSLEKITKRQEEIETEVAEIRISLSELKKQEQKLAAELTKINSDRAEAEREMKEVDAKRETLKRIALDRIRALYIYRDESVTNKLFVRAERKSDEDIVQSAFFLSRLRDHDTKITQELVNLKDEKSKREAALRKFIETQDQYRRKVTQQKESVRAKLQKQETLIKTLAIERTKREGILAELKAQALRLETVVTSLVTGATPTTEEGNENTTREEIISATRVEAPAVITPYEGNGLIKNKVPLAPPVSGKAVRKFGKYKTSGFSDTILSKGVSFMADLSSPVSAIAPGRVMFEGILPGYDKLVIVDHGARYYSLYGLLSSTSVKKGDLVEAQQQLGLTGGELKEGKNFYFEIRKNGESVNPQGFYRKKL